MRNPPKAFVVLRRFLACAGLAAWCATAGAQQPTLKSHEVNPDLSVTFRYYAPAARKVTLSLDYSRHRVPLTKSDDGVWSLTTGPLQPALHIYSLAVDGAYVLDPFNPSVDASLIYRENAVLVTGPTPQLWDRTDVPHGVVSHHAYRSAYLRNLPFGEENYQVYTPPGYEPAGRKTYPVLYLLHGWSQLSESWLNTGQADLILDNLIAQGLAKPMILVMPLAYGDMAFVANGFSQWSDEAKVGRNLELFTEALLTEIEPQVEAGYRVSAGRDNRAIAGLSMGGGESLIIGLNHPDLFGWIGGFSSAVMYRGYDGLFPRLASEPAGQPRLLWIACGTGDDLITDNRRFVSWIRTRGLQPVAVETPGIHNWPVWRDNLAQFASLLFRGHTAQP